MILTNRDTGEQRILTIKHIMETENVDEEKAKKRLFKRALDLVYNPSYARWLGISNKMNNLLDKFKDAKLVEYQWTERDRARVAKNPDAINNIPRLYVPKLDKIIESDEFEKSLRKEFFDRFLKNDPAIIRMVNISNKKWSAKAD